MLFSSLTFICYFLPVVLILYFSLPKARDVILVFASLLFYAWGEPVWVLLLIFSGTLDYCCGRVMERNRKNWRRGAAMGASLIGNLGLLFTFKYAGFVFSNINAAFGAHLPETTFNLPLGISFYTFQTLSYSIDVYRGKIDSQKNYISFMAYVTMFPQLVAGPVVRYSDIAAQLKQRDISAANFSRGVTRFSAGLAKKMLLANQAGKAAAFLLSDMTAASRAGCLLGMCFFAFQIYFDFSGYSDMAIGMGRMLGFDFKENFNYPYIAQSVSDFWRRWHISLSTFFRDYLYIPLGGNRRRHVFNILIVWLLTGIWHGANWNFALWGLYFGCALLAERYLLKSLLNYLPGFVRHIYTISVLLVGWSIFYFTDLSQLNAFFAVLFGKNVPLMDFAAESMFLSNAFLLIVLVAASTPIPKMLARKCAGKYPFLSFAEPLYNAAMLAASFAMLIGQSYNPFLYFRF